jgi:hypothetical protein
MTDQSYLRFGNGHAFDPEPGFSNHQCHWAPWAEHYRDAGGETGMLANMLGNALEEIDRLLKWGVDYPRKHAALLFAFIEYVETGELEPFPDDEPPMSPSDALESIKLLNRWRRENTLNIKAVDVR